MTVTLGWWIVPLCFIAAAIYIGSRPSTSNFDFVTPTVVLALVSAAIIFTIAYWVGRLS